MGRWPYSDRLTTDDCKSISVQFLKEHGYLEDGIKAGGMSWNRGGHKTGSIGFVVSMEEGKENIRFQYTQTDNQTDEKTSLDYEVQLTSTPCHFGGRRWWFECPLSVNGHACGRRVGVLYLRGKYFGCRHCYDLTYRSSKEHDKRLDWLRKNPDILLSYLRGNDFNKKLLVAKTFIGRS